MEDLSVIGIIAIIISLASIFMGLGYKIGHSSGFLDGKCDAIYGTGSVSDWNKCLTPVK